MDSVTVDDGFYCYGLQNCIVGEQIWKECKDNASHRLNTRNEHLFPVFNVQRWDKTLNSKGPAFNFG